MFQLQILFNSYKQINKREFLFIKKILKKYKKRIKIKKILNLSSIKKKYTLLKSPHVNKKSKEHFQYEIKRKKFFFESINSLVFFNFLIFFKKILPTKYLIQIKLKKKAIY